MMQSELSDSTIKSLSELNMTRIRAEVNTDLSAQKVYSAAEDQSNLMSFQIRAVRGLIS